MKTLKKNLSGNRNYLLLTGFYIVLLLLIGSVACLFSYKQRKDELLAGMEKTDYQLEEEMNSILDNFWQLYMPIFEDRNSTYPLFMDYFSAKTPGSLNPMSRLELTEAVKRLSLRDNRVQWIALYSPAREINYIYYTAGASLQPLPDDFPYLENLRAKESQMELYGVHDVESLSGVSKTFALCGSTPRLMDEGAILAGYSISSLQQICENGTHALQTLSYRIESNGQVLFDSSGQYPAQSESGLAAISSSKDKQMADSTKTPEIEDAAVSDQNKRTALETGDVAVLDQNKRAALENGDTAAPNQKTTVTLSDSAKPTASSGSGKRYVTTSVFSGRNAVLQSSFDAAELERKAHRYTPVLLLLIVLFAGSACLMYSLMLRSISKEVNVIRSGLNYISGNHLDYLLPVRFSQSGLNEIAESINTMTKRLQENINRAYYYEMKQKETEIAELQAKFNPHFLYNSLEMVRTRCYQNGDTETAQLITQLSTIFRGFIGSRTFVPLSEELAFSKHYLSLFRARYGDLVTIRYDIDTELLDYGTIRNLFQPLIENYFVHGFNASSGADNCICFRGKSIDASYMLLTVEDNGCGMEPEQLAKLNATLGEPIRDSSESYGLKNLNQRLRLFYGEDCGLVLKPNGTQGLLIEIKVKKLRCEEVT